MHLQVCERGKLKDAENTFWKQLIEAYLKVCQSSIFLQSSHCHGQGDSKTASFDNQQVAIHFFLLKSSYNKYEENTVSCQNLTQENPPSDFPRILHVIHLSVNLQPEASSSEEQLQIAQGLASLRNSIAFCIILVNALLALAIFLIQKHKDILSIKWTPYRKYSTLHYEKTSHKKN